MKNKRIRGKGAARYRLKEDEEKILLKYRRIKQEAENEGLDVETVHSGWIKNKNASLYFKQPNPKEKDFFKLGKDLIKELKEFSPEYPKLDRDKYKDPHLFFCSPSDLHIGKLCKSFNADQEYNSQIAVIRTLEGVRSLIKKAQGFNIDKVVLLLAGDLLHVDSFKNTTTNNTAQDVDGLFSDNFMIAKRLMVEVIEMLLQVADVHCMYTPGNHDMVSGWMLAQILQTHFRHNKNTSFDVSLRMRKYYKYGTNENASLIGSCHGDKIKFDTLPLIMADECNDWSSCKFRYMFTQHIHHKLSSKQFPGIHIESLMSPSESDNWHHKSGYQSSNNKGIEGFLISKNYGQVARLTHLF